LKIAVVEDHALIRYALEKGFTRSEPSGRLAEDE